MNKTYKNFKIWGVRSDLIGDTIMSLPILTFLEKKFPKSYKYFSILKKCSQAAPLYLNHPLIDNIKISDFDDGFGQTDLQIFNECNLKINTRPPVNDPNWFNKRGQVEECFYMAGFSEEDFNELSEKERKPQLSKWFDSEIDEKAIAIWPFAGYGKDHNRAPSVEWWSNFIEEFLIKDYKVLHFGWVNEPNLSDNFKYKKCTKMSFFDQIKMTTNCKMSICTDTGSSWVFGAYGLPQITLLTNHFRIGNFKHGVSNKTAFAPENINNLNINIFAEDSCSNIEKEIVWSKVKDLVQ